MTDEERKALMKQNASREPAETHEPESVYVIVKRVVDKLKKEAGIDG